MAVQTTLMDLEAYSLSSIVTITFYSEVGRARPSYADCKANPSFSPDGGVTTFDSFPSAHTNEAFTAAGLSWEIATTHPTCWTILMHGTDPAHQHRNGDA